MNLSISVLPELLPRCLNVALFGFHGFDPSWLPPVSRQDSESTQEVANKVQEVRPVFTSRVQSRTELSNCKNNVAFAVSLLFCIFAAAIQ